MILHDVDMKLFEGETLSPTFLFLWLSQDWCSFVHSSLYAKKRKGNGFNIPSVTTNHSKAGPPASNYLKKRDFGIMFNKERDFKEPILNQNMDKFIKKDHCFKFYNIERRLGKKYTILFF